MSCQDVAKVTGQHLLFCGVSTQSWSASQFQEAAQFARAHDVDALLIKAGDGGNLWYGGLNGYQAIRQTILNEGVGCIPYIYSYGDKYGYLDGEIDILIALMKISGVVCADMEAEWNGQVAWGQRLCQRMQGVSGIFLVSTWADPSLQSWQGVIQALNPCVSAYMPQQYNNYLGTFWGEFGANGASCLQPTLNMLQDVGPNDPVALARAAHDQGHTAISVWYYDTAEANPALLDQIFAAFPKTLQQEEEPMSIDLSTPGVSNYFVAAPGGAWHCPSTGATMGGAILDFYCKFGNSGLNGLTWLGLPLTSELGNIPGKPGVVFERFERGVLAYDPNHVLDKPPGVNGPVYLMHINQGLGEDPRVTDLQGHVDALTAQVTSLQQTSLAQQNTALEAKIAQAVKDLS